MSGETHEIEIPWQIPWNFLDTASSSPWVSPSQLRGVIARVTIDVLRPLRITTSSAPSVDVSVFVSFVDPELVGAVVPASLPFGFEREVVFQLLDEAEKASAVSPPRRGRRAHIPLEIEGESETVLNVSAQDGPEKPSSRAVVIVLTLPENFSDEMLAELRLKIQTNIQMLSSQHVQFLDVTGESHTTLRPLQVDAESHTTTKGKNMKEAEDKSESGTVLSGAQDFISTVTSLINLGESMSTSLAPLLAVLDKPNDLQLVSKMQARPGDDMMHGTGIDHCTKMSLTPTASLSSKSDVMGSAGIAHLYDAIRTPGWFKGASFTTATVPATIITDWGMCPWWAPSTGAEAGYSQTYAPDYLAWYSQMFRFWRGSIKFLLVFSAAKFTTCRVRVTFIPNVRGTFSTTNYSGDVYSVVLDVKGDTVHCVTIPFVYAFMYADVEKDLGATDDESNCTGSIQIEVINQPVSNDATAQDLFLDIWRCAGDDFQFNLADRRPLYDETAPSFLLPTHVPPPMAVQRDEAAKKKLLRALKTRKKVIPDARMVSHVKAWRKSRKPLNVDAECSVVEAMKDQAEPITTSNGYLEEGHVAPETFGPICDLGKSYCQLSDAPNGAISFFPQVISGELTPYHWIQMPYVFYRGGCRYKLRGGAASKWISFGQYPSESVSETRATNLMCATDSNELLQVEMPWYSRLPFTAVDGSYHPDIDRLQRDAEMYVQNIGDADRFVAMGDDFQLGALFSPPRIGNRV
jgi:hypothetical protein